MIDLTPQDRTYANVIEAFNSNGLPVERMGKTRIICGLPHHPEHMLIFATDRVSARDQVLNGLIRSKGEALTAMVVNCNHYAQDVVRTHLMGYGRGINNFVPAPFANNAQLQRSGLVTLRLNMLPVEVIPRGWITDSAWREYQENGGVVCGIQLPPGLYNGARLDQPIFTSSTKAPNGEHDINITYEEVCRIIGKDRAAEVRGRAMSLYDEMVRRDMERGIIDADTKFEFGIGPDGKLYLGDEYNTTDSSRKWFLHEWQMASREKKPAPSHDKDPARWWADRVDIDHNPDTPVPDELVMELSNTQLQIVEMTTGKTLEQFQSEDLRIAA